VLGKDFQSDIGSKVSLILKQKGRGGELAALVLEATPGYWGTTQEEIERQVSMSIAGLAEKNQISAATMKSIEKGNVLYGIGRMSGPASIVGCRVVAVVSLF
jgi:hypothetical protein